MGYNNKMYQLFQEMLDGYKTNNDGLFQHGARCLIAMNPINPFKEESKEADLFFTMSITYARWNNHSVDAKINMRRMLAAAQELCSLVKENPYVYSKEEEEQELEELKRQEELKKQEELNKEEIKETNVVVNDPPQVVLGILPENKDEKKEKKSWFKFLNPWKKEGDKNDSK